MRLPKSIFTREHPEHFTDIQLHGIEANRVVGGLEITPFGWLVKPEGLGIRFEPLYSIDGLDSSYPIFRKMTGSEVSEFIMIEKHKRAKE